MPRSMASCSCARSRTSACDRDDPAVLRLDQAGGLLQVVRGGQRVSEAVDVMTQVDGDDVRAFLREPYRVAAALAAAGAR